MQPAVPPIAINEGKTSMTTVQLSAIISPKLTVVSVLCASLLACSYNAQIVENAADGTQLDVGGSGTVIHGTGSDISGHVRIAEVFYSDGSFWSQGKPSALEKWINKRSHLQVRFMPRHRTERPVYLSPTRDIPVEKVDPDGLFNQPMLLLDGKDSGVYFSGAERENLRRYLVEKGGFLFVDDSSKTEGEFYRSIRRLLAELLPAYPIEPIPDDHEIYGCFYEMGGAPVGMNSANRPLALEGISINGRLAVLISQRGYWDLFTGREMHYSPGVMRFGTNMVVYAVTRGDIADHLE